MARLKADAPFLHPDTDITESRFGAYVEIGRGTRVAFSSFGDYSYCDRYADIANAEIGKFANIAAFVRIGPTDHPMDKPALHHFLYRSADLWDDAETDAEFFARRRARIARVGHDTWIGHGAVVMPGVSIGNGAIIGANAVVTKDVADFAIAVGVPARTIKQRFSDDIASRLDALAWWDWEHERLHAALHDFRVLSVEEFLERHGG